jgi:hypothetical protein
MTMLGHTESFGKMARDEMESQKDALFIRMLYNLPLPLFRINYDEMTKTPDPEISVVSILYAIIYIGKLNVEFYIDPEADKVIGSYFGLYRKMVEKSHTIDNFFG